MENTNKFCTHCGAPLTANQEFCGACGQKVGDTGNTEGRTNRDQTTKTTTTQDTVSKMKDVAIATTTNLADVASKKTGKQIKPAWLVGGIGGLVVLVAVIYMLIPKGLSGSYRHTTTFLGTSSTDTWVFKGKEVTEAGTSNHGTYKISGDDLEIDLNGQKMTAKLSDDKKSFTLESAPGLSALANGTKYTKVEK